MNEFWQPGLAWLYHITRPKTTCQYDLDSRYGSGLACFFHTQLAQAPKDDGDSPFTILISFWKRINAMLPNDVPNKDPMKPIPFVNKKACKSKAPKNTVCFRATKKPSPYLICGVHGLFCQSRARRRIPAEVEQHAILLREVDELPGLRMPKGQLPRCPEGDANGAVLSCGPLLIEGRLDMANHRFFRLSERSEIKMARWGDLTITFLILRSERKHVPASHKWNSSQQHGIPI